ncbi:MAG: VWA domain-containing protein [Nitrospinota bacterium]
MAAFSMILNSISVGMIPVPGTALDEAIRTGVDSLKRGRAKSKALVIITDGENHTGDPLAAARYALDEGVTIFTVGIGSEDGVPLPEKDSKGKNKGFKTDRDGKTVITRLNSEILRSVALKSGGGFFAGPEGISRVAELIEKMEKSDLGSRAVVSYEERYQYVVFLSFLFFLIEMLVSERRKRTVGA